MHHNTSPNSVTESPYNPHNVLPGAEFIDSILQKYGNRHPVQKIEIFWKALTHRSYCTRKRDNFIEGNLDCPSECLPLQEESSERLEFLGDAILNLVVADYLFRRYPDEHEGFLTRMRSKLVNGEMLRDFCLITGLDVHVIISKQIEESGGRQAKNVLEDCFEAFIGAMFVDAEKDGQGYKVASEWLINFIETNVDFAELIPQQTSYKDMLTKYFQHAFNCAPRYAVDEIPMHAAMNSDDSTNAGGETIQDAAPQSQGQQTPAGGKPASMFTVCIRTRDDAIVGTGSGLTKKAAENEAARKAMAYFGQLE